MTRAVEVHVTGRVQGVSYRASTRAEAERRGLVGWVRNEPDGSVRALLQGPPADVEAMIAWCAHGPSHARVDALDAQEAALDPSLTVFMVRR